MIFVQDLTYFTMLWSHLLFVLVWIWEMYLLESFYMDLGCVRAVWSHCNASGFMLKTLLSIAQQSGPFKSSSLVLLSYSPSLLLLGLYPFHFQPQAKAWESMYSYLRKDSKNLNFLILYRFWNSTCILWVPFS